MRKHVPIFLTMLILVAFVMSASSNASAASTLKPDDGISVFNGKWVSTRWTGPLDEGWMTEQSMHIQCHPHKSACRIFVGIDRSFTCSDLYGYPTGLNWKYNGPVQVDGLTITTVGEVDLYCLSKPPSYLSSVEAWFTYNEVDDTLTDFGTTWYRE